ncbi:MAG: ComF family protein [Bacteroidetes bacterium]|nr:ComF family protein [Bacteroidota bacterium]
MNQLIEVSKDILHLFYPNVCVACHNELVGNEQTICTLCWHRLPLTHFHLQKNNPVEQRFFGRADIQHASSMYYFHKDSPLQSILHALKYKGNKKVGTILGKRCGQIASSFSWIKDIDVIIPIPLSKQKYKQRGYNQSEFLAQGFAEEIPIPLDTTSVIRAKNTISQTTLSITERMQNMKDAFTVIHPNELINKHILLIDDVMTTGATLEACAKAILQAQASKVSILTLAYAIES